MDSNHAAIRDGLRKCGFFVQDLSAVGQGFPDLLVATSSDTFLLEVKKDANECLTEMESTFFQAFPNVNRYIIGFDLQQIITELKKRGH